MPPLTPSAIFMIRFYPSLQQMPPDTRWLQRVGWENERRAGETNSVADGGVESLDGGRRGLRLIRLAQDPLHFAGGDLFLGNAASLARVVLFHQRARPRLDLAGAARSHQHVTVIAVKTIHQLHRDIPRIPALRRSLLSFRPGFFGCLRCEGSKDR